MQQGPASQTSEMNKEEMAKLGGHWFQNKSEEEKNKKQMFSVHGQDLFRIPFEFFVSYL